MTVREMMMWRLWGKRRYGVSWSDKCDNYIKYSIFLEVRKIVSVQVTEDVEDSTGQRGKRKESNVW